MSVQHNSGRFRFAQSSLYCIDDLPRSRDVTLDVNYFTAVTIAVDQCAAGGQFSKNLSKRERAKTNEQVVRSVRFFPWHKYNRDRVSG